MDMPGREYVASEAYGYEFNGKETDEETFDGAQDFGLREYDGRLGRFFSRDPFACYVANKSTYSFAGNSPITFIDCMSSNQSGLIMLKNLGHFLD